MVGTTKPISAINAQDPSAGTGKRKLNPTADDGPRSKVPKFDTVDTRTKQEKAADKAREKALAKEMKEEAAKRNILNFFDKAQGCDVPAGIAAKWNQKVEVLLIATAIPCARSPNPDPSAWTLQDKGKFKRDASSNAPGALLKFGGYEFSFRTENIKPPTGTSGHTRPIWSEGLIDNNLDYKTFKQCLPGHIGLTEDQFDEICMFGQPANEGVGQLHCTSFVSTGNMWFDKKDFNAPWETIETFMVLKHFVRGDLPKEARTNFTLRAVLKNLKREDYLLERPTIYAQYLVDRKGVSPTPRELLEFLVIAEEYAESLHGNDPVKNENARQVDSALKKVSKASGLRKYIDETKVHVHQPMILFWIKCFRNRLINLPVDEPLERPIIEVGYATKPIERLDQHAKHDSSNYLMNLMEAICMTHGGKYKMVQYVVFECVSLPQAMFAEILFTRIGLGYVAQGGGFSHHAAGLSHQGATKMATQFWERKKGFFNSKSFKEAMKAEVAAFQKQADIFDSVEGHKLLDDSLIDRANDLSDRIEDAETARVDIVASTKSSQMEDCFQRFWDFNLEPSESDEDGKDEEMGDQEEVDDDQDMLL